MGDDLVRRLEIKASMIEMGEKIAWGSDSAIMREAASALAASEAQVAELREALAPFAEYARAPSFNRLPDDFSLTQGSPMARRQIKAGDCTRALAALSASPAPAQGATITDEMEERLRDNRGKTIDPECIVCPRCGHQHGNSDRMAGDRALAITCAGCGTKLVVWTETDVTYHAKMPYDTLARALTQPQEPRDD